MSHDACVPPTSYSRQLHPRPRPGPAAAAHTPRVRTHRHDEVTSRRTPAKRIQHQVSLLCTTLCSTTLQPAAMLRLSAKLSCHGDRLRHKPSSRHTLELTLTDIKIPTCTSDYRTPCKTKHINSATNAHDIHSSAPVQQQLQTLHATSNASPMKCRLAVTLHSVINRNDPCCAHYAPQHCNQWQCRLGSGERLTVRLQLPVELPV
jgi:hypothetical protein